MQPVEARILRGLRIFVIENKTEVKQFLDGLATANALYIQIRSLDKGGTSAEFRVAGAQAASTCSPPIAAQQPRRSDGRAEAFSMSAPAIARSQLAC